MIKKLNKQGGEKIISVYWFVILFIVAAAIVYATSVFYGGPYDVRELEVNILTNKIAGCFSEEGYLNEGFFIDDSLNQEFQNNFLEKCNLNFDTENVYDWNKQGQYYAEVKIHDFYLGDKGDQLTEISAGNINLKKDCFLEGKGFPVCLERSFYVIDKENNQYEINILSVVRKIEKNVQ